MSEPRGVLLDTHAAIWLVAGELNHLKAELSRAMEGGGVLVSAVTAWEIGLLARERAGRAPRMRFQPDVSSWYSVLVALASVRETPLTATMALAASTLPGDLHDDPADRLLIATARELGVPIVTRDKRILDYAEQGFVAAIAC